MGALDKLNRLFSLYGFGLKGLYKPVIWLPFFIYFCLQALLLILLNNYPNQYIYPILSPFIKLFGAEQEQFFTHYPSLYIMLPFIFQMSKLVFGILFEGLIIGLTSLLFIRSFRMGEIPVGSAVKRWLHLSMAWILVMAVLFAIGWYLPQYFESFLFGSPKRVIVFEIGLGLTTVLVYSLFIYAVPAIVNYQINFLVALKKSLLFFFKQPIFSFFLAFIVYVTTVPVEILLYFKDTIVSKFAPELVFYILLISLIIELIAYIVFIGALTKFLVEEN